MSSQDNFSNAGCVLIVIFIIFGAIIGVVVYHLLVWTSQEQPAPSHHAPSELAAPATPVPVQASKPIPQSPKDDSDNARYEQLLRNRLKLQEEIFKAFESYTIISQRVHEGRTELQRLLGNKSVAEAVELFSKNTVPSDLRPAHDRWRTLIPDERTRFAIIQWLEKRQTSNELVNMDVLIKDVENRRDFGWALGVD